MALELSQTTWQLGFTIGLGQAPRLRKLAARDLRGLLEEIRLSRKRFGLPENVPVLSCYEAGRDGFWLHRYLTSQGVTNLVVDSASIEVNRRKRRTKTDRLDVVKLLTMLIRYAHGEQKVWSVLRPPSPAEEDQRQLHRELLALKRERTYHINRLKGLLANQGVLLAVQTDFLEQLDAVRLWDGGPLPPGLHTCLQREYARSQFIQEQVRQVEKIRLEAIRTAETPALKQVRQLLQLKGLGVNSAWLFVMEFFAWRNFRNRREVGALAGRRLSPTARRPRTRVAPGDVNRGSARPAIAWCAPWRLKLPGFGCAISRTVP
jgi:transposase